MKRLLCLLATLCLCFAPAAYGESAVEAAPLTGVAYYPAGSDDATATCVFEYAYPQFDPVTQVEAQINAYYAALAADMAGGGMLDAIADLGTLPEAGMPAWYMHINYRITATNADYISVLLQVNRFLGNAETESWMADVFARNGVYQGQPVSLSQAMGLETEDGVASQDVSYAAGLAYGLIWQIIQSEQAMQTRDYFAGLTLNDLQRALNPESDFYLDTDGNIVFFVQSGEIASEVEGVLTFPFAPAELLSAAR